MKYVLMVRSRMDPRQSIPAKHTEFVRRYSRPKDRWPFPGGFLPTPDVVRYGTYSRSLRKYLPKGMTGRVTCQARASDPADAAYNDDFIALDFNPATADYRRIVGETFPRLVVAFRGYRGEIHDEQMYWVNFNGSPREAYRPVNGRHAVGEVYPVAYYDARLCLSAFGLTPEAVVERLTGKVEAVKLLADGVFLFARSEPVNLEEAGEIDQTVRGALQLTDRQRRALTRFTELIQQVAALLFEGVERGLGKDVRWKRAVLDARSSGESGAIFSTFRVELKNGKPAPPVRHLAEARFTLSDAWRAKGRAFSRKWYGLRLLLTPDGACKTVFNYDPKCLAEPGFISLGDRCRATRRPR
jgi:hypothetical protein